MKLDIIFGAMFLGGALLAWAAGAPGLIIGIFLGAAATNFGDATAKFIMGIR